MSATALQFRPDAAKPLLDEVTQRSGQNLSACYQCRRCAAGCPVTEETGNVSPDFLIRMIALGDSENALSNELVWKCVSCYTCGTRCPNNIHSARITETLKKMADEFSQKGYFPGDVPCILSMGMSADYTIAIEEGATLVRVGTAIFGERE